jgi:hypothetical protein
MVIDSAGEKIDILEEDGSIDMSPALSCVSKNNEPVSA